MSRCLSTEGGATWFYEAGLYKGLPIDDRTPAEMVGGRLPKKGNTMNSLSDPGVAELLDRLHREAVAQTPELRKRVAAFTLKGGTEYSIWVDTTNERVSES